MSLDTALYSYLQSLPEITSLIGDRIFPDFAPEHAGFPRLVTQIISESPSSHLTGASGFRRTRIQLDVYSKSRLEAVEVQSAIFAALHGYRQRPMGDEQLAVSSANVDDARSSHLPPSDGTDQGTHRITIDVIVQYCV